MYPQWSFHFISLARCLLLRTEHPALHPLLYPLFQVSKRLLTSKISCADPRERGGDGKTDPEPLTGYEPNRIVDNQIITEQEDITCTEDSPTTSHCCLLLKILLKALLEADLDDEHIRALLASPRYLLEREASAERPHVYHSERGGLMSSSSQGLNFMGAGEPFALFSHERRLSQDAFSEREREQPVDVSGSTESIVRDSYPTNLRNLFLMEIEITCLLKQIRIDEAEAKSGI